MGLFCCNIVYNFIVDINEDMKLSNICICTGILLFLVDLGLAKKKVENYGMEIEKESIFQNKKRRHLSKSEDEEDDVSKGDEDTIDNNEGENNFIYACDTKALDPICTCKGETLDCHKQLINHKLLNHTYIKIREQDFIVKTAYFNNNGIKTLKKGFIIPDNVEHVKRLKLSHNLIAEIENNAFDIFDELETLEMRYNLLTDIDHHVLTKMLGKTLQILNLDNNKIRKFSNAFNHLHNLKELHINSNPVIKFSKEMFPESLAKLEELHLTSCNIQALDDDIFLNLKNLKTLILFGNPLTSVPKALNNIPHLITLDLSATKIETLTSNAFNQDSKLSEISFFSMPNLTYIDDCAFCGLPNLTWIGLWGCEKLTHIHENAFGGLTNKEVPHIRSLYLDQTNLTVLPERLLNWELIEEITIHSNNPLACNCSMAWLINDYSLYKMFTTSIPKCASPPELINVSFATVSGTICLDNAILDSSSIFWPIIFLAAISISFVAVLCYTRRIRKPFRHDLPTMSYRNLSTQQQHHDDEEELQAHF